ncbi:phospholipid/cholesterol/gamma-HCH transport system substrate-binding protein [Azospirillaceae bacterium]
MSSDNRRHKRLGVGVLLILILLLTLAISARTYFNDTLFLKTYLLNVSGLHPGTEILMNGMSIGHIVTVHAVDRRAQSFEVLMRLDQNFEIPKDSKIATYQSSPIDTMRLAIQPGTANLPLISGQVIPVAPPSPGLLDAIGEISPKVTEVVDKATHVMNKVSDTLTMVQGTLDQTNKLLENANRLIDSLVKAVGDNGKTPPAQGTLRAAFSGVQTAAGSIEKTIDDLHKEIERAKLARVVSDIAGAATKTLDQTRDAVEATAKMIVSISVLIKESSQDIKHITSDNQYIFKTLARDIDGLSKNLNAATFHLKELAREMREDPSHLLFGRKKSDDATPEGRPSVAK